MSLKRGLSGFSLRIHPSRRKVWIVQNRLKRRSRRIVIDRAHLFKGRILPTHQVHAGR